MAGNSARSRRRVIIGGLGYGFTRIVDVGLHRAEVGRASGVSRQESVRGSSPASHRPRSPAGSAGCPCCRLPLTTAFACSSTSSDGHRCTSRGRYVAGFDRHLQIASGGLRGKPVGNTLHCGPLHLDPRHVRHGDPDWSAPLTAKRISVASACRVAMATTVPFHVQCRGSKRSSGSVTVKSSYMMTSRLAQTAVVGMHDTIRYRIKCGAVRSMNCRHVMILVFFQNGGKCF